MVAALPARHTNALELPTLRQFTVPQYLRLIQTGVLGKYDQVELIDGWIVNKMTRNASHDSSISRLIRLLGRLLPVDWVLRCQSAVLLPRSVPEPDLAVFPGPIETYDQEVPAAGKAALLIEVAESSLAYDRDEKSKLYAQAHVPVYWLVNLVDHRVEVYTQPRGGSKPCYRHHEDYHPGDKLPLQLGKRAIGHIAVSEILPRQG